MSTEQKQSVDIADDTEVIGIHKKYIKRKTIHIVSEAYTDPIEKLDDKIRKISERGYVPIGHMYTLKIKTSEGMKSYLCQNMYLPNKNYGNKA